ncbi:MAG: hypothetical protein LBG04_02725 [Holosporaceae bacterium]|nr:hypothetical protein [Holosporaceae bacterium]
MNFTEGNSRKKHSSRVVRAAVVYVESNGFRRQGCGIIIEQVRMTEF